MIQERNSKNFSYWAQFGILMGLFGAGLIFGSLVSGLIWMLMTKQSIFVMQTELLTPKYYLEAMVIQAISTLFIFFIPAVGFAAICYHKAGKFLGTVMPINSKQVVWVLAILVLVFPVGGALAEINKMIPIPDSWAVRFKQWEADRESQEAALININTLGKYIASIFIIALLPALFEEFFFRAGLQNLFTRWLGGPAGAIILTSVIFSAVHGSYYGFLVRFALGVILGSVFYISGSIWLSVLLHFLFNGLQVTALYIIGQSDKLNTKDLEKNFPIWMGLIALFLLFIVFKKFSSDSRQLISVYKENEFHEEESPFHNQLTDN